MAKSMEGAVSIDEALAQTKFGKFNYFVIVISGLILINVVLECLGISFVLPVINCDMHLSYQEKGILGGVGFLGIITSSHLWGFLSDTTGRKSVIQWTLLAAYLITVISSLSPNFITLVILRFVNGFLISGGSATIFAYLGEFHCNQTRNRALMSAAFISATTALLHPIVAWATINQTWSFYVPILDIVYNPWRLYILVIALLGPVCGICFFYFPESPKYLLSVGMEKEAIAVLRRVYTVNTGDHADSFKVHSIIPDIEDAQRVKIKVAEKKCALHALALSMWNQTAPIFMREHWRKTILACIIQFWIFFTGHGLYMWFPFILNKVMQFTSVDPSARLEVCEMLHLMEDTGTVFNSTTHIQPDCVKSLELTTYQHTLSLEVIYVTMFLGVGYFTGKLGRIPTLLIILLVCGACGVLSAVITIPIVAVYFMLVLLSCGLATTVLNVITVDIFPTHLRAMAVCISLMMGRIGSITGSSLVGGLLENNCKAGLLTCGISLILSGFLGLLLPKSSEPKKIDKLSGAA